MESCPVGSDVAADQQAVRVRLTHAEQGPVRRRASDPRIRSQRQPLRLGPVEPDDEELAAPRTRRRTRSAPRGPRLARRSSDGASTFDVEGSASPQRSTATPARITSPHVARPIAPRFTIASFEPPTLLGMAVETPFRLGRPSRTSSERSPSAQPRGGPCPGISHFFISETSFIPSPTNGSHLGANVEAGRETRRSEMRRGIGAVALVVVILAGVGSGSPRTGPASATASPRASSRYRSRRRTARRSRSSTWWATAVGPSSPGSSSSRCS